MLTEVMRFYGLARPPVDAGFFETEHHAQVSRDIRAAIVGGRLIALTAVIGSGKTILSRRLRADLEREGRVIVSRSLSIDKAKISLPLLVAALFYDLTPEKTVTISSQSRAAGTRPAGAVPARQEARGAVRRRRARPPSEDAVALKRLIELVAEGGGQLSIVLVGHPKLKNDLRRPKMEEIGDRTTVFEFGGLRDRQRDYIDWVLKASLKEGVAPDDVLTDEAATLLAAKLKTPLQIGQHLVRAFEAGFEIGAKPIDRRRRRGGPVPQTRRTGAAADAQRLRPPQPGRAVRCQASRNPPAAARRPGRGPSRRNSWTRCAPPDCRHDRNGFSGGISGWSAGCAPSPGNRPFSARGSPQPRSPAAHFRLTYFASGLMISRPSQRACAQSQTPCVGTTRQSQLICAGNRP